MLNPKSLSAGALALGLMLIAAAPAQADVASDLKTQTDAWNALLQKHVRTNGGVDYQGLDKDQAALESFIKAHATVDAKGLAALSDRAKRAVYINLYNATMMFNMLRHAKAEKIDVASAAFTKLEVSGIKVPGGNIWNGDYKIKLAGTDVNLDNIEHDLIRGKGDGPLAPLKVKELDPRIHSAVNCAAMSCPRVREVAYRDETIDAMLEENMKEYLSAEAQFSKEDDDTLKANQIVFWYYDDFEEYGQKVNKKGAGTYLATFVQPDAKDAAWKVKHLQENFNDRGKVSLKLSSAFDFHYDWRVNDIRNRK